MKNSNKNIKGVTLVSLIITIIVLIILASIGTYSGVEVIKSSKFTKFTTEMKIMQTHVNQLYEQYINGDDEVLNLGKEINTVKKQADIVFYPGASGITEQEGYRYFDQETIQSLNIEGVEEEFFVNIQKRSLISYKGFKYEDTTYFTLEQLPNGLYNVDYEENTNKPEFETNVEEIGDDKWRVSISKSDIKYEGYIDKWEVKYKLEEKDYWNTSDELDFVLNQGGKYLIKIVNENVESEEKNILLYKLMIPDSLELTVGEEKIIDAAIEPAIEEEKLIYLSSDETIAKVDETGKVTGVAEGTTTITVTGEIVANNTKSISVTVNQIVE